MEFFCCCKILRFAKSGDFVINVKNSNSFNLSFMHFSVNYRPQSLGQGNVLNMSVILSTEERGSLYDVTSCLATWSHDPSGGLCLWSHVPCRGGDLSVTGVCIQGVLHPESPRTVKSGRYASYWYTFLDVYCLINDSNIFHYFNTLDKLSLSLQVYHFGAVFRKSYAKLYVSVPGVVSVPPGVDLPSGISWTRH